MIQNLKQPQGNYVRNCWDRATHPHSQRRRRGGRRRAQEGLAAVPVGGGGAWPDNEPTHPATRKRHSTADVEGAGGRKRAWLRRPWAAAGPGRGAGGWRQGQGGPRDRPLRAAGSRVAISRAGRRQPAHTAAGPHKATQEPLNGIAKGAGISRPLARVPSLIHEGHLDATHQRGDDVVEHGSQRR